MPPHYQSEDIVPYAVLLLRSMPDPYLAPTKSRIYAAMRVKFPDISDRNLRDAFEDAKLLLAIRQASRIQSSE